MRQRPEYFVWIEISGIIGLLALLLDPLAYLATDMMGGGGGGGAIAGGTAGPAPEAEGPVPRQGRATPVPGLSPRPSRQGPAPVPFSERWRARATPDLSRAGGGSVGAGSGGAGGGPPIAFETQADSDPGSPDDPGRRNPGSPSNVPIGDHLPWLAVAGILWGAWRIGRGA